MQQQVGIVTTNGTDGACAAAAVLLKYPEAEIYVTSRNSIHHLLRSLPLQRTACFHLHLVGVGVTEENLDETVQELANLCQTLRHFHWYCGRGYLDQFKEQLQKYCRLHFQESGSNTATVVKALGLTRHKRSPLLLELAAQFAADQRGRRDEHKFWHDLVTASHNRYFQFGQDDHYPRTIRKLAGLSPITPQDEQDVALLRKYGDKPQPVPLGTSKPMKALRAKIDKVAGFREPVLILGPSGSGKELVARAIHDGSQRKGEKFLAINCAILNVSPELAYDRLFGHKKGAYTGADKDATGAFLDASGGTLFLDEVAELPAGVQKQLLRVLEEHSVMPLGGSEPVDVDVRLILATNRPLGTMVQQGEFREDLFYRINTLVLWTPALHERFEDARPIAEALTRRLDEEGLTLKLTRTDWAALKEFDWPGNIRQFCNVLRRMAYLQRTATETLQEERHLLPEPDTTTALQQLYRPATPEQARPMEQVRNDYARHVLELCGGSHKQAAKVLGVAENTLRGWMK